MARGAASRKKRKATRSHATVPSSTTQTFVVSKAALLEQAGMTDVTALPVEPSQARLALESIRQALATDEPMTGDCANCDHSADDHAGAMNDGACSIEDCDCEAMVAADDDDPVEVSAKTVAYVTIGEEAQQAAIAALLDGVELSTDEAIPAPLLETFRVRFNEFIVLLGQEFDTQTDAMLPDAHQPGETVPPRAPSPAAPEAPATPSVGGQLRWRASMVPEATLTDDGRAFAPDSITWRELPLTLMAMIETTEGGHVGALVSGRIDRMWRDADGMIWGEGVFDEGDYGSEIGRMVGDGTLRGISVDVAVQAYEVGPRSNWFDEDGNWAPSTDAEANAERSLVDVLYADDAEPVVFVVTEGVIGAATVCPFQAFADAKIELAASLCAAASPAVWTITRQGGWIVTEGPKEHPGYGTVGEGIEVAPGEEGTLTAAAAGLAPVNPPAEWFADPQLGELTPLVVTAEGRVYGHAAAWDTCHIGIPDVCTTAPHSNADYAYFHLKEIECDDGERIACGTITLEAPHADRGLGRAQATAHYDNTGMAAVDVVAGEDAYGIWVAGALRPDMDAEKVRDLRGAVLSGDWRAVNGNLELVALLAVNVPGFPVPRVRALVAAGDDGNQVLALVAAGVHNGPVEHGRFVSPAAQAKFDAYRDIAAGRFTALAERARDAA